MRRSVVGTIASVTYHVSRAQVGSGEMAPYLIAGAGLYGSRRVATHYPECQPLGPCDRTTHTLQLRDRQFGASGGVGVDARVYGVPAFVELRVHYMYADTTAGEPSNDYFLIPLSVGLRFR
jgi:hypothetical protein